MSNYISPQEQFRIAFWEAQESGMFDNDMLLESLVGWLGPVELRRMCIANELYVPGFEQDANWINFDEDEDD